MKRWISIAMVIAMLCSLTLFAGCGDEDSGRSKKKKSKKTTTTSSVTEISEVSIDPLAEVFDQADEYVKNKDFDGAISLLENAYDDYYDRQDEIEAKKDEVELARLSDKMAVFDNAGDVEGAIKYLQSEPNIGATADAISEKLEEYSATYRKQVLADAEAAFTSGGYSAAIDVINNGLYLLPDDTELAAKKAEYAALGPDGWQDLVCTDGAIYYEEDIVRDPRQKEYRDVIAFDSGNSYSYAELYTGGQYSTISADFFPDEDFPTGNHYGFIKVYVDDELAYTSPKITYKTENVHMSVNIKGAKYVKIVYDHEHCYRAIYAQHAVVEK